MTTARRDMLMSLREGDVIRLNRRLRVVRKITERQANGYPPKRIFTFAILRCSWTNRPYTTYTTSDLGNPRWSVDLIARNYQPKQSVEHVLNEQIALAPAIRPSLTCCDIHGVA